MPDRWRDLGEDFGVIGHICHKGDSVSSYGGVVVYQARSDRYGEIIVKCYERYDKENRDRLGAEVLVNEGLEESSFWPAYYGKGMDNGLPVILQERLFPVPFLEKALQISSALDVGDLFEYGARGFDALAALHQSGWMHGDTHNGNFLLCFDEDLGRAVVKLIDFNGGGRLLNCFDVREDVGVFLGEIQYMCPEDGGNGAKAFLIDLWGDVNAGHLGRIYNLASVVSVALREKGVELPGVGLDPYVEGLFRKGIFGEYSKGPV